MYRRYYIVHQFAQSALMTLHIFQINSIFNVKVQPVFMSELTKQCYGAIEKVVLIFPHLRWFGLFRYWYITLISSNAF